MATHTLDPDPGFLPAAYEGWDPPYGSTPQAKAVDLPPLETVIGLACEFHHGQLDCVGQPYILHVLRVLLKQTDPICQRIALLHDIVPGPPTGHPPFAALARHVPAVIVDGVDALTRRQGESYPAYIERLALNPYAVPVKIADLLDDLDPNRQPAVMFGPDIDRQLMRQRALQRLFSGRPSAAPPPPAPLVQIDFGRPGPDGL